MHNKNVLGGLFKTDIILFFFLIQTLFLLNKTED